MFDYNNIKEHLIYLFLKINLKTNYSFFRQNFFNTDNFKPTVREKMKKKCFEILFKFQIKFFNAWEAKYISYKK